MQQAASDAAPTDSSAKGKNFGLSAKDFHEFLGKLEAGDESLFEQVFVTQFRRCTRHLMFKYQADEQAAEDAVMNALLDFRKLLLARKVTFGNLEAYFIRMAMTAYQRKRQLNRETPVDHFPTESAETDDATFTEEDYTKFANAWAGLCDKCRALLQGFYYDNLPHSKVAERSGKHVAAIKQDKHRCVEKLRKIFFAQTEKY